MRQKHVSSGVQNASIHGANILNSIKMEFCPKCGILLVKRENKSVCTKCNYSKEHVRLETKEKIPEKKKLEIIKKEESSLPIIKADCPKCGNREAYFWSLQTRGSDESETSFFKCTKCKHTRRQYT